MSANIFDATKYCNKLSEILNHKFVTIKQNKNGRYYPKTTSFDVARFFIGVALLIWLYIDLSERPFKLTQRSIIFEIGMVFNSKLEVLHPIFVMFHVFCRRHEYFRILNNIMWIDKKVSHA